MTVIIKLKDKDEPYRFDNVFKITESAHVIFLWFNGEWNTPRGWNKSKVDGAIKIEL